MKIFKLLFAAALLFVISNKPLLSQKNEFESDVIKIGIVASDLKATVEFYQNIIGLIKVREFEIDSATATDFGFTQGKAFHVTCFKTVSSPQATEIKILSFGKNETYKKPVNLNDNLGMQYMTIYVKSVQPVIQRLRDNKVKFLGKTPVDAGEGKQLILVQDPNGVFVEIIGKE
jgi:catechol 2,3-dioxygenase-like lactoylglutathione lyase family enzyme